MEKEPQLNQAPESLKYALSYFSHNGDSNKLYEWIEKNGVQKKSYNLGVNEKRIISHTIQGSMETIKEKQNYKKAMHVWKIFYESGLLTEDILKNEIDNYMKSCVLSKELLEKFKKDLEEKIKKEIGLGLII